MGKIVVSVKVENALMPSIPAMQMDALVDTGSSRLTLPNAWRERLGDFPRTRKAVAHTASETVDAIICSPAVITIAGFPQIDGEILLWIWNRLMENINRFWDIFRWKVVKLWWICNLIVYGKQNMWMLNFISMRRWGGDYVFLRLCVGTREMVL